MNDNKTYYLYGKINKAVYALLFSISSTHLFHMSETTVCERSYCTNIFNKNFIKFVSQYVLCK